MQVLWKLTTAAFLDQLPKRERHLGDWHAKLPGDVGRDALGLTRWALAADQQKIGQIDPARRTPVGASSAITSRGTFEDIGIGPEMARLSIVV